MYSVYLSKYAQRQLAKLNDNLELSLLRAIQALSVNPRPKGYKKLRGREAYRIRKGNFRIIYEIYDKSLIINVIALGDRKDIYE